MSRFDYIKYDQKSLIDSEAFKDSFERLELMGAELSEGRSKSLFLTHLEEAFMWIGKAIRDDQIKRNIKTKHVPERG